MTKKVVYFIVFLIGINQNLCSQVVADTIVSLGNIEIQGIRFGGLSGGKTQRLQVEDNLSSMTGTTAEALRQIPSLHTDIEGGITYRGSTKAHMQINNVPYGLLEEYNGDILIQLPALFFNQITVSSYPPIQWAPDGDAGMINLGSSRSSQDSPLQISLGAGWNERYNAGAVVNLHPDKFHITAKYNYRQEYRERRFQKTTTHTSGTTEMNNNASARPVVHLADLSVDYDITPNDRFTVYGLYHLMSYNRYGAIKNTRKNPAGEVINRILRHRFNEQRQEAYAAEARWKHHLSNHQLEVILNYNNFTYDEENDFKNEDPQTAVFVAQDNLFIRQKKDNFYAAGDYQYTLSPGLYLNAGYAGHFKEEKYTAEANNLKDESWIANPQKSDAYIFRRSTHRLYACLEKKGGLIEGEIGLQAEYNTQKIRETLHKRYHLYPRAAITYLPSNKNRISFTYLQRVIRPTGAELNTFINQSDMTHISQGNPNLKNESIHSLALTYSLNLSRLRLLPAVYYRNKTNRIMETAQIIDEQTVWRKENIGHSQILGAEATASWSPGHFLSVHFSGNLFWDEIDGRSIGYTEKKSLFCWDLKTMINIHLTARTELQFDGFYLSDQLTPQGKIKKRSSLNAGISQYLMQKQLRVNLSIYNILDTLEETTIINTEDLHMKQIRNRDARVAWLTFTYSL
ncbi:TonB-dependent receptor [Parabacteroides sp. 52]|uniref:outer membrane beta-barrel family protein n=1 Tax=unclassified Parabacteroides TaxID=2649774 RepID=UPI0013D2328B|nr:MULTISPECIES: outer membrane beta-barrel family protein [unclassified Parabacteroides]MDH6534912.1 iron complex outermembrane receptor protein [Parabacteroides sp. PM5-20]NDV55710.1 TonB-dependent receptor [Parabacteroides sp. 52]